MHGNIIHSFTFVSHPDAYDDGDVIFKWKNADVHVSRDSMAQFKFLGASFTSNMESYLDGNMALNAGMAPDT